MAIPSFRPLNFAAYHHKPPLLFWLIDASWTLFGATRWSATAVVLAISSLCLYLTGQVARLPVSRSSGYFRSRHLGGAR